MSLASSRRTHRHAFTLVEMLVVIAIIAVLAAMLLPAINMAREAARKASCTNNLRQLAMAVQQFDTAKGKYPPSRTYLKNSRYTPPATWGHTNPPRVMLSWVHEIMPYFEKQDMRELVERNILNNVPEPVYSVGGRLNIVLCPSDETDVDFDDRRPINTQPYSQLSYACNSGVQDDIGDPFRFGFDWPANGVFENRLQGAAERIPFKNPSLGDVTSGNGASNTILLAENSDLEEYNWFPTEFHVGIVWDDTFNLGQQLGKWPPNPPGTPQNVKPATLADIYNLNSPTPNYAVPYARPLSGHPSGFMFAFCDGRVKFVSDNIDYDVYCLLMSSHGKKYLPAGSNVVTPAFQRAATLQKTGVLKDGDY